MPTKKRDPKRVWVDPDDAPEWSEEHFKRAEIAVDGDVVSHARGTLTRPAARPDKADSKMLSRDHEPR
jgi:hypothetical protein